MCLEAPCVKAFPGQKNLLFRLAFQKSRHGSTGKAPEKERRKKRKEKPLETQADQGLCPDPAVPCFHIGQKEKPRSDFSGSDRERWQAPTAGRTQDGTPRTTAGATDTRQARRQDGTQARLCLNALISAGTDRKKPRNNGPAHALRAHARLMEETRKAVPGSKAARHGRTQGHKASKADRASLRKKTESARFSVWDPDRIKTSTQTRHRRRPGRQRRQTATTAGTQGTPCARTQGQRKRQARN